MGQTKLKKLFQGFRLSSIFVPFFNFVQKTSSVKETSYYTFLKEVKTLRALLET